MSVKSKQKKNIGIGIIHIEIPFQVSVLLYKFAIAPLNVPARVLADGRVDGRILRHMFLVPSEALRYRISL